jgi:hypothetical protein
LRRFLENERALSKIGLVTIPRVHLPMHIAVDVSPQEFDGCKDFRHCQLETVNKRSAIFRRAG